MTRLSTDLLRARARWLVDTELLAGAHTAHNLDHDSAELWRVYHEIAATFLTTPQRVSQTRRTPALTVIEGGE
jgi:hypothetical protein